MTQKQALQEALDEIQKELTEIERLKGELAIKEGAIRGLGDLCREKDKLVTELADWIDSVPRGIDKREELLKRAREAVR